MPSLHLPGMIIDYTNVYKLRLDNGTHVFMDWHEWCGPTFYRDKQQRRIIEEWYEDDRIVKVLDWFVERGCKA